jgi:hypothetical protein
MFSEVAESWGDELESAWNDSQGQRQGATCVIDLSNVKAINSASEKVIRRLAAEGVRFRVGGLIADFVITLVCNEQARAIRDRREFKSIISQSES